MKLSEVKEILNAEVLVGEEDLGREVSGGAASDLMSDLLKYPMENALLLTGLTSIQAINTSLIAGMAAIVFVRGKNPESEVLRYAREQGVPILTTNFNMYSSCGRLYHRGLKSIR